MNTTLNNKRKFLFIYLKTGGGHLAPAKSLSKYLDKHNKEEVEVILVDGFEGTKRYARFVVEDGYRILQSKFKWFYELIYAIHKVRIISEISSYLVSINMEKYLSEIIQKEKPKKIVLFHFFAIKPVYKIIKELKLNIPVITIVTDPFIAPPLWFLNKNQKFILFSEELKDRCIKKGIDSKNIKVFDFVLDEKYSKVATQDEILSWKKEFGFQKEKVLLILGGGDGIPKGIQILKSILKLNSDFEIVIVCGKNKEFFEQANKIITHEKYDNLKIYGFVDFVYELISISDVVISKCGASTFMELLISGKIQIVNSFLWEQEKGNVDFLIRNNLGIYEKNTSKLPAIINQMFTDNNILQQYKKNIASFNFKNGIAKVASFLLDH
ncbi:MAG: hypothetical protein D4R68_02260 [Ignavibacteriales bacterium]|nr:MAG: hypothetical protein D4R68_02260 [Ignavibacteriales bacterium]